MKSSLLKTTIKATLLLIAFSFINNVMAQNTLVNIKVKQVPVLGVATPSPAAVCSTVASYSNGSIPTGSYDFNIPTIAGVSAKDNSNMPITNGITYEYAECDDATGANANWASPITDPTSYNVIASVTAPVIKYIAVRAYMTANVGCYTNVQVITLTVKQIPVITIAGNFTVCGNDAKNYTTSIDPSSATVTSYAWTITNGATTATATTANPSVTWNDVATNGTGTISLTYEVDGCTYTVTQSVTINARPVIAVVNINDQCYPETGTTVDLTAGVTGVTNGTPTDVIYSETATFDLEISATAAAAFDVSSYAASGITSKTIWVKVANTATCNSDIKSFTFTVYPQITADLLVTTASQASDQTAYEDCANADGTNSVEIDLTLQVTGGCPTASSYTVGMTVPVGMTLSSTSTGVTVSGSTITITGATARAGVVPLKIRVEASSANINADLKVGTVTVTPNAGCTISCSRTFNP